MVPNYYHFAETQQKKHQQPITFPCYIVKLHSHAALSNYIPLLHNKDTNKQTQIQETTNTIPKNWKEKRKRKDEAQM